MSVSKAEELEKSDSFVAIFQTKLKKGIEERKGHKKSNNFVNYIFFSKTRDDKHFLQIHFYIFLWDYDTISLMVYQYTALQFNLHFSAQMLSGWLHPLTVPIQKIK